MFKLLLMYTDGDQSAYTHGLWPTVPQLGTTMRFSLTTSVLVEDVVHDSVIGMIVIGLKPDPKSPFLPRDTFDDLVDECGWKSGEVAEWGQYLDAKWGQLGYSPKRSA